MFGVDSGEFFIIILVAVVVIGPKELPRVMRTVGRWIGKARSMANQFRSGVDQMVRDTEIADLERKWREQNEAIMRANPLADGDSDWGIAPPPSASSTVSLEKAAASGAEPVAPPVAGSVPSAPAASPAGQGSATARRQPVVPALLKPAPAKPGEAA